VVLYEMLAGRPPFQNGSPVELALCHLQDPPPPLPAGVPARLREVVDRALAKDPAARFSDALQMAEALRGSLPQRASARPRERARNGGGGREATLRGVGGAVEPDTAATAIGAARVPAGTDAAEGATATLARTRRQLPGRAQPPPRAPAPPGGRARGDTRRRRAALVLVGVLALAGAIAALLLTGGPAHTTVPVLRGLPFGGVVARARRLHVRPVFSRRYAEAAKGTAIAQSPRAGTRVDDGAPVRVVLSAGPPPVPIPGVVGEPAGTAEAQIAQAGLRYSDASVAAPAAEPGAVVLQSPGPGASVPRGSTVALSVAETPRWRPLTTFSGIDGGHSVAFRILGRRWRVSYSMAIRGTCVFLVVCEGPHATVANLQTGTSFGGFELEEGGSQTHTFASGPGLYRIDITGGRDSARWSMAVEDFY
jgi:hypothetical protein